MQFTTQEQLGPARQGGEVAGVGHDTWKVYRKHTTRVQLWVSVTYRTWGNNRSQNTVYNTVKTCHGCTPLL